MGFGVGKNIIASGMIALRKVLSNPHVYTSHVPHIYNIYVLPEWRGCGFGKNMLGFLISWAQQRGYAYVTLTASDEGRPLYEKMGFKPTRDMRLKLS
jgi:GNAT superfamily N-acetyltransferase